MPVALRLFFVDYLLLTSIMLNNFSVNTEIYVSKYVNIYINNIYEICLAKCIRIM